LQTRLEAEKDSIQNRYDFEKDQLRLAAERNLLTQEEYNARSKKLEETRIKRLNAIAKKQFEEKKKQDIQNQIVDTTVKSAQAFINAFVTAGNPVTGAILGAISAAIVGAQGITAISAIRKREYSPITFADGGIVHGRSHSEGGIPFTVSGKGGYEMEGGEYIVKKSAVNENTIPLLDAINNDSRYNSRYFETGGRVNELSQEANTSVVRAFITDKDLDAYERNKNIRTKNKSLF